MSDPDRYAITVKRVTVEDENLWRATVRELPDIAEFADTREEAFDLALDAIVHLKQAAIDEDRQFPEPIEDEEEYSGRVTLRMPAHLHRTIAEKAQADDMSLNAYIVATLSVDLAQRVNALSARHLVVNPRTAAAKYIGGISAVGSATLTTGTFYNCGISARHTNSELMFGRPHSALPVFGTMGIGPEFQLFSYQKMQKKILE